MEYLKLRLEPGKREAYIPAIDGYISIREDGVVTVKKASGQENFRCQLWDMPEAQKER